MKAIVCTRYGPPEEMRLMEVPKPVPRDSEVLIKVHAATVTTGDCELRRFKIPFLFWLPLRLYMGILKPRIKIYGQELSGVIEAVGKSVTRFQKGDSVFTPTTIRMGAYGEYICLPATFAIALKPISISHDEAAAIPTGGLNALHFIRKGQIKPGEKVLINGAGGSIGTQAVQLAKLAGAEVTCVDRTEKLDMLRHLGADHVIDYLHEDFTKGGPAYDAIIDVVGKYSYSRCMRSLKAGGRYVLGNPGFLDMIRSIGSRGSSGPKALVALADYRIEDMNHLRDLIETGKIKAVIDRKYPLEEMAEAHRYVESGNKKGNVVITVGRE